MDRNGKEERVMINIHQNLLFGIREWKRTNDQEQKQKTLRPFDFAKKEIDDDHLNVSPDFCAAKIIWRMEIKSLAETHL